MVVGEQRGRPHRRLLGGGSPIEPEQVAQPRVLLPQRRELGSQRRQLFGGRTAVMCHGTRWWPIARSRPR